MGFFGLDPKYCLFLWFFDSLSRSGQRKRENPGMDVAIVDCFTRLECSLHPEIPTLENETFLGCPPGLFHNHKHLRQKQMALCPPWPIWLFPSYPHAHGTKALNQILAFQEACFMGWHLVDFPIFTCYHAGLFLKSTPLGHKIKRENCFFLPFWIWVMIDSFSWSLCGDRFCRKNLNLTRSFWTLWLHSVCSLQQKRFRETGLKCLCDFEPAT